MSIAAWATNSRSRRPKGQPWRTTQSAPAAEASSPKGTADVEQLVVGSTTQDVHDELGEAPERAIGTERLGDVQPLVGDGERGRDVHARLPDAAADRGADGHAPLRDQDVAARRALDLDRDPLELALIGNPPGHDHELVAAQASDARIRNGREEALSYCVEHAVARDVAPAFVDLLEVVEVDHNDRRRLVAGGEQLLECLPGEESRELVELRGSSLVGVVPDELRASASDQEAIAKPPQDHGRKHPVSSTRSRPPFEGRIWHDRHRDRFARP